MPICIFSWVHEKNLFKTEYKHQNYQPESFLLFIEKSFYLSKQGGVISLIIPNTWATNLKFVDIRRFITSQSTIINISHYHHSVFDAVVDTEVVTFEKRITENQIVNVFNHIDKDNNKLVQHKQEKWKINNGEPINIFADEITDGIISLIKIGSNPLKNYCDIYSGVKPYEVEKGHPPQTREMLKSRVYDSTFQKNDTYRRLIRGKDIRQFINNWDGHRWIKYGKNLAAPRKSSIFNQPKIIIRQTGDSLIATYDDSSFICLNNTHVINSKNGVNLKFILALLNSSVLTFYFQYLNPETGEALAEVKKANVEKLLIKSAQNEKLYSSIVDILLYLGNSTSQQNDFNTLRNVLDSMVFELYFTGHLKEREIDILQFVERDFEEILGKNDFDILATNEKENIINQLHTRWTHPDSEVRNRIKLFAVRSPEILKPILESR